MSKELQHVSFSLTKREIKALNKYRKEWPGTDTFEFKLTPTGIGVAVQVRPKDSGNIDWTNITDYGSW